MTGSFTYVFEFVFAIKLCDVTPSFSKFIMTQTYLTGPVLNLQLRYN
jgi:hypothetical protein